MPTIVDIIGQYISLQQKGREYVGKCPFHNDNHPSLKVNPEKNIWKCFPCDRGGTAYDFVKQYGELTGRNLKIDSNVKVEKTNKKPLAELKMISPIRSYYEQPSFRHFQYGVPENTWAYTNEKGETMFYVCRFSQKDGTKEVLPYIYATDGTKARWVWKGIGNKRPLYKLHKVVQSDNICLVEGEKTADAGNRNSKDWVFTTFQGGSKAWKYTDYTHLKGKNVCIIDDNDEVGHLCMDGVQSLILANAKSLKRIKSLDEFPDKWDIADKRWREGELDNFIKEKAV